MEKYIKEKTIWAEEDVSKMRLDVFVAKQFPKYSRAHIQRAIRAHEIVLNGKAIKPHARIKPGDEIKVKISEDSPVLPVAENLKIPVVFENKEYVVINKPAGIQVHPSKGIISGTVVNWLLHRYPEIQKVGETTKGNAPADMRPGVVHRLDKNTSGVMVIAKTQRAFRYFKKLFQKRLVEKAYVAVVRGVVSQDEGTISFPIARSRRSPTKQAAYTGSIIPSSARDALTHYRTVKRYKEVSVLEVSPKTGRMHQIRVHCAAIGHPVLGDTTYGSKRTRGANEPKRQLLHAKKISFVDPSGEKKVFLAPLPSDIKLFIRSLSAR